MSGIYYALSIVAIFVIINWFIANDRIAPDQPTKGLLAMNDNRPGPKADTPEAGVAGNTGRGNRGLGANQSTSPRDGRKQ
jgi:hypothetical protein